MYDIHLTVLIFLSATPYICYGQLGLENGAIPSQDISVSSRKNENESVDAVRMGQAKIWTAAANDVQPWIQIRFPSGKNDEEKTIVRFV